MRHIESNAIARLLLVAFVAVFLKPAFGAHASEKSDSWRVSPTTEQADGTALIKRQLYIGGRHTIRYTGRAGFIPMRIERTGELTGEIFFTAYVAEQHAGKSERPITFVFGGGPGSPASLSRVAPRIVDRGENDLRDNPDSWLKATDLVLIDAMGTGYSRMTGRDRAPLFFTPASDAEAIAEFIRIYIRRYESSSRPVFLAGGSYGSLRGPLVAQAAARRGIPIRGLILSQVALGIVPPNDISAALFIPSFTAAAHAHGRLSPELQADLDTTLSRAEDFAMKRYLPALARGNTLTEVERSEVAAELSAFTGLDTDFLRHQGLRISAAQFADNLLRSTGRQIGHYDTRIAQPLRQGPWDPRADPSLAARPNVLPRPMERLLLTREFGIMSDRIYAGPFGGQWPPAADPFMDWMYYQWWGPISISNDEGAGTEKALPAFVAAVTEGAGYLHALLISGAYDIATPYFAAEYAARKVPLAYKDNVVVRRYAGGHMTTGREFDAEVLGFINRVMATPAPSRPLGPLEE